MYHFYKYFLKYTFMFYSHYIYNNTLRGFKFTRILQVSHISFAIGHKQVSNFLSLFVLKDKFIDKSWMSTFHGSRSIKIRTSDIFQCYLFVVEGRIKKSELSNEKNSFHRILWDMSSRWPSFLFFSSFFLLFFFFSFFFLFYFSHIHFFFMILQRIIDKHSRIFQSHQL